jgi:multicomponent Na+:H+ antiporter subunit C
LNGTLLYLLSGVAVFAVCLHALIFWEHLIRKVLALNIMGSGVFLLLTAVARRGAEVDPVPHAMVLTGIVVAVSATAFALALIRRLEAETGRAYLTLPTPAEPENAQSDATDGVVDED